MPSSEKRGEEGALTGTFWDNGATLESESLTGGGAAGPENTAPQETTAVQPRKSLQAFRPQPQACLHLRPACFSSSNAPVHCLLSYPFLHSLSSGTDSAYLIVLELLCVCEDKGYREKSI